MLVTCTKNPTAYIGAADLAEGMARYDDSREALDPQTTDHTAFNFRPYVDVVQRELVGFDGLPYIIDAGCGRTFDFELDPRLWDVNTAEVDGLHVIVERHVVPKCPWCGKSADLLSEPVVGDEPLVFTDRLERAKAVMYDRVLRDEPELAEWPAERIDALIRRLLTPVQGGAGLGYAHVTEGAVALAAATAKTIIGAKAGAAAGLQQHHVEVSYDGVTATAVPVLTELCYATFATNSPGTNSTGTSERQEFGRVLAVDWAGARNWTAEPTALTVLEEKLIPAFGGLVVYDVPLGKEPDTALAEGLVIRCNAPAVVNVRATQKVSRI